MPLRHLLFLATVLLLVAGCDQTNSSGVISETAPSGQSSPTVPPSLRGAWYLRQVDSFVVLGESVALDFRDSSRLSGSNGRDGFQFSCHLGDTTFRLDTAGPARILFGNDTTAPVYPVFANLVLARSWKASDEDLVLRDSTGRVLMRYTRTAPKPLPTAPFAWAVPADTNHPLQLRHARLERATVDESGVHLRLAQSSHGLEVRLIALDSLPGGCALAPTEPQGASAESPQQACAPKKILVVGWDADPTDLHATVLTTVGVFVPWSTLPAYVSFVDRTGNTLTRLRPGWTLP